MTFLIFGLGLALLIPWLVLHLFAGKPSVSTNWFGFPLAGGFLIVLSGVVWVLDNMLHSG